MSRLQKNVRKTLDLIAQNNESTTHDLMRAALLLEDSVLRQKLLNAIHQLNQDALTLKQLAREAPLVGAR